MSAPLLLLLQLTLPGFVLAWLLRLPGPRFLHSVGLSFSLFVLLFVGARSGHWTTTAFSLAYFGIVALTLFMAMWRSYRAQTWSFRQLENRFTNNRLEILTITLLAGVLFAYLLWAGPYIEIPSDALAHLKYMQQTSQDWLTARNATLAPDGKLMNSHTWYDLVSYSLHLSHTSVAEASQWLHLITIPLFLAGVFSFALILYHGNHSRAQAVAFASLSSLLVAVHFGVNVFAFIRYYALAPTMINLVVYFAAMALVLDMFRRSRMNPTSLTITLVYFSTMTIAHTQEALFMAVMTLLLALYYSFAKTAKAESQAGTLRSSAPHQMAIFTTAALIVAASVWYYAHHYMAIKSSYLPRIVEVAMIGGEKYFVLNPENNFYQTLTSWGLIVYALFLVYFRDFLRQPYLLMGMLSPLATVFNPFFIDLFIRFYSDNTLWRFAYLAPIHFSAAHIVLIAWKDIKHGGAFLKGIAIISILLLVFGSLLPLGEQSPSGGLFARHMTLKKTEDSNSPAYYRDLLAFLDALSKREHVLTDPMTAYVISALTPHDAPSNKFFPRNDYKLKRSHYEKNDFSENSHWLVVVNQRPGNISETGQTSHHWYADALNASNNYSPAFTNFVKNHPARFKVLWQNNDITVYRIQ